MDPALASATAPAPIGFEDGLGTRRRAVDRARNETVEMLCLRSELTAVPSFEFALRERLGNLAAFSHACYGHVRSVERLKDPASTLALVSDVTPGLRLSEMLRLAEASEVTLDIDAALCLLRQLVPAVAMLHENEPDTAHGAIAAERLIVTPGARLIVVEHVMGSALEQLRFSQERYWRELRVAVPRSAGLPKFDHRADVTQIGVVALSLILGRRLHDEEAPSRLGDLVSSAWAVSTRGGLEPLPAGLRSWLMCALQLDPRHSFESAIDAQEELERVLGESDYLAAPTTLESFLERYRAATEAAEPEPIPEPRAFVSHAVVSHPAVGQPVVSHSVVGHSLPVGHAATNGPVGHPVAIRPVVAQESEAPIELTPIAMPAPVRPPSSVRVPVAAPPVAHAATHAHTPAPVPAHAPATAHAAPPAPVHAAVPATPPGPAPAPAHVKREPATIGAPLDMSPAVYDAPNPPATGVRWQFVAAAVALIALAGVGVTAMRRYAAPSATTSEGTLVMTSNPPGAKLFVDGVERGVTPVTVTLKPGAHQLELRGDGPARVMPITMTAGAQVSQYIELPKTASTSGQLQVRTEPAGARVSIDGTARGTSPVTVPDLTPGEHAVLLESDRGTVKQIVAIEAGITASLMVPLGAATEGAPVSGWIAVTAPADVQVFENKRLLGTSQSDRLMVSAGRHEIEIVNETLGYRGTRTVQVTPGKVTPIKIDFPKGAIALNAVPWAEVWVDGEKIGDTPIGNLSLAIGAHEIVFRHPDLGEQRHAATVTLNSPARLSVDMRKK